MPLVVNLRHLEAHNVVLKGELPVEELDIDPRDEVIQVRQPLEYDLEVQKLEDGLLRARPAAAWSWNASASAASSRSNISLTLDDLGLPSALAGRG